MPSMSMTLTEKKATNMIPGRVGGAWAGITLSTRK
jgi:hypothetical protein